MKAETDVRVRANGASLADLAYVLSMALDRDVMVPARRLVEQQVFEVRGTIDDLVATYGLALAPRESIEHRTRSVRDGVRLDEADRVQIARLHQEIDDRIQTIGVTMARVIGDEGTDTVAAFRRERGGRRLSTLGAMDQIIFIDGRRYCYQDPPGVCCAGTCPCE